MQQDMRSCRDPAGRELTTYECGLRLVVFELLARVCEPSWRIHFPKMRQVDQLARCDHSVEHAGNQIAQWPVPALEFYCGAPRGFVLCFKRNFVVVPFF